jgi:hypothetical protein
MLSKSFMAMVSVSHTASMNKQPNEALQATAAAPLHFRPRGDSRLPGFVVAQLPAAVPDLARYPNAEA